MSGLIEKAKLKADELLHKNNNKNVDNPHSTNQGPHSSNAANKADPRVDSDRDGAAHHGTTGLGHNTHSSGTTGLGHNTHGTTGTGFGTTGTGYGSTTAGPHDSNLANKADPRVDSDRDGRSGLQGSSGYGNTGVGHNTGLGHNTGYGSSTTAGPHDSNLLNKADPRVDSDRDGRSGLQGSSGYGHSGVAPTHHATTGQQGYGSSGYGNEPVHNSNLANKLDPRVDSTTTSGYGSSGVGQSGIGHSSGHTGVGSGAGYGSSGVGSGLGHQSGHTGVGTGAGYGNTGYGSSNAGPHDSNFANKVDPRVDSDRDNRNDPTSRVGGYGGQDQYGSTGAGYGSTGTGLGHSSGTTGYGQTGVGHQQGYGSSATPGSGNAEKTAGPHNSNLLNKLDPRVDSDVDGSKTVGGNKTHY